jgi:hypothetical protein
VNTCRYASFITPCQYDISLEPIHLSVSKTRSKNKKRQKPREKKEGSVGNVCVLKAELRQGMNVSHQGKAYSLTRLHIGYAVVGRLKLSFHLHTESVSPLLAVCDCRCSIDPMR